MDATIAPVPDAASREAIRLRFLEVDTSNVADVLDDLGYPNQGLAAEFAPYSGPAGRLAGWAYTIRGQMAPFAHTGDPEKMKACQGLSPGEVTVWSGDGDGICYFGELIAIGMKERVASAPSLMAASGMSVGLGSSDSRYSPAIEHPCSPSDAGRSMRGRYP
jgi:hypothetical protein